MKESFVDINKVSLRQITKTVAKDFVVKHHYSHRFSSCRYALGVYYEEVEPHPFFDGKNEKLIGAMVYGHPVCNMAVNSITSDSSLRLNSVLELTRLVILDGYGSNIESYVIGQSFRWLKQNAPLVKVLISYADPEENHAGTIYQATNFLYQGIGASKLMCDYSVKETPDGPWIHSRSVSAKWGSKNLQKLAEKIGHVFWRKEESSKHRYIYFLCNKREKRELLKKIKLPIIPYPDSTKKWEPPIQEIELVGGKVLITEIKNDMIHEEINLL